MDLLIDEISEAALEAIEQAAGEAAKAAKAAVLSVIEREALLLQERAMAIREAEKWRLQAELNAMAITEARKAGGKNTILAALIGILGGLAVGVGGTMLMRN